MLWNRRKKRIADKFKFFNSFKTFCDDYFHIITISFVGTGVFLPLHKLCFRLSGRQFPICSSPSCRPNMQWLVEYFTFDYTFPFYSIYPIRLGLAQARKPSTIMLIIVFISIITQAHLFVLSAGSTPRPHSSRSFFGLLFGIIHYHATAAAAIAKWPKRIPDYNRMNLKSHFRS